MIKRNRLLWAFGGMACFALLGTLLQYDRLIQLYLRYKLERQPEELLRAYALSNDENKREAIRLFASTQDGGKCTASVLIQTLCDGVEKAQSPPLARNSIESSIRALLAAAPIPAMCSRGSTAEGVCDMEFYLGRIQHPSFDGVMLCYEELLWDFSRNIRGTALTQDVVQYAAVLLSALSGKAVRIESINDGSSLILDVKELANDVEMGITPLGLIPVCPYSVRLRTDDSEKTERFGKVLMDGKANTRIQRMRAAEALGKLSTPEAHAVLQDALALDDLDMHFRAVVEKALDEALAGGASEKRG